MNADALHDPDLLAALQRNASKLTTGERITEQIFTMAFLAATGLQPDQAQMVIEQSWGPPLDGAPTIVRRVHFIPLPPPAPTAKKLHKPKYHAPPTHKPHKPLGDTGETTGADE